MPVAVESARPRARMSAPDPAAEMPRVEGPEPTEPVGPAATQPSDMAEQLRFQIPDPESFPEIAEAAIARTSDPLARSIQETAMKRVAEIRRPKSVRLSLRDCIQAALRNSYRIRASGYNPAIETTRIVEAEAQFDAVYFLNLSTNKQDRPSSSQLQGTLTDTRVLNSGVRKLLSTGTQVSASYAVTRTYSDLIFQTLNPAWFNQFAVEFRQPLLRGFGLDYNRAQIELSRLDRRISFEQFRRELQQTVFDVEQAYWRLLQARMEVVNAARLLAAFRSIYEIVESRAAFDTFLIQRGQIRSRLETREADFVARKADVRNAEDALKALINAPELNLAEDVEIIPTDPFMIAPIAIDRLGEVQAALDNRPELRESKLQIERARVVIGATKNQALPKFDVVVRYIVDGLGGKWDSAFDQLTENDYNEYYVGIEFEWPIGNRGPEAALRRARLQQAQAVVAHAAQIEQIIAEVHQAVRQVQVSYEQLGATLRAARASEEQLEATRARQLSKDPANLEVELNAVESLAASRSSLTNILVNYNVAIVSLERQKGTLLRYNNIEIRDPGTDRPLVADFAESEPIVP